MTISYGLRMLAGMLMLWAAAAFSQPVTITKDTQLRAAPKFDSTSVAPVKQGTMGDVTLKQGPWLLVNVADNAGWVPTSYIVFGTIQPHAPDSIYQTLFGYGRGSVKTTSTIGIRCAMCDETFMQNGGVINESQLSLLDGYAVSKEDAYTQHAKPLGLKSLDIPLP